MSIGGWGVNDPDPDSDIEPSLDEVEGLLLGGSSGWETAKRGIAHRVVEMGRRYPEYEFDSPFFSLLERTTLSFPYAIVLLELVEAMQMEVSGAWLAGKLRRVV